MSALTDRIAAEHRYLWSNATCGCGFEPPVWSKDYGQHIAEVTEAAVREQVARDIGRRRDEAGGQPTSATGIALRAYIDGAFNEAARIARGGAA